MGTERSFAIPLLIGSVVLVAAILAVLAFVPLLECPRCTGWILSTSGMIPRCGMCGGERKVSWMTRFRWRQEAK